MSGAEYTRTRDESKMCPVCHSFHNWRGEITFLPPEELKPGDEVCLKTGADALDGLGVFTKPSHFACYKMAREGHCPGDAAPCKFKGVLTCVRTPPPTHAPLAALSPSRPCAPPTHHLLCSHLLFSRGRRWRSTRWRRSRRRRPSSRPR